MNGLLEGLEVSIVRKQHVLDTVSTKRLDPEYFQKRYLLDEFFIKQNMQFFRSPTELGLTIDASAFYPSIEEFYGSGDLPFYRVGDVDGLIDDEGALRIPQDLCDQFPTLRRVEEGDILFTKGGAIDRSGYVTKAGAVSRDLIFLNTSILPENQRLSLFAYFQTALFRRLLTRSSSQTAQPHLTITLVRQLPFFQSSGLVSASLAKVILAAYGQVETAMRELERASGVLLDALGLADWMPPEPLTYAAKASDALAAGRLDAQYFMPAKEQVKRALAALPGMPLSGRVNSIREQWVPDRAPPTMRVRNYDVTDALVPLLDAEKETSFAADIGSMKKVLRDGDVAVSRLRAYLKEIAVVRTGDAIPSVGSSEFIVLRLKGADISPETLMVFLRSQPVQTILKWCQDGSQHPRFSEADLLSIPVPDAVAEASAKVTLIVQEGFAARDRARRLLDAAKRAVEIAIEDSDAAALDYLAMVQGAN